MAPTILVNGTWVRDLPATIARRAPPGGRAPDVLWSGGSSMAHSRYVRGAFPALHLSDGLTTAGAEIFAVVPHPAPRLGVPSVARVQVPVAVHVPRVLDVTDPAVRRRLRVHKRDVTELPDWTALDVFDRPRAYEFPQAIGELAYRAELAGIRYPSARATRGANLVIFPERLREIGGRLQAENPITGVMQSLP